MTDTSFHCTFEVARRELKNAKTIKLDYLMDILTSVSSSIDLECQEEFEPIHESRIVYPSPVTVSRDTSVLTLKDPETQRHMRLLDLEAVVSGTKTLVVGTEVGLYNAPEPSRKLKLLKHHLSWSRFCHGNLWWGGDSGWGWGCAPGDRYAVQITGWWGYRERYATDGWRKVDKLAAGINDSVEALTVSGGINLRSYNGSKPRFAPGLLLRIDEEVMRVLEVDNSKTVPLLLRGVKGTDPDAHLATADVYVWSVQPEIVRAAQRWVTLLQGRQGVFETSQITDVGILRYPDDMPSDVRNILRRFLQ